MSQVCGHKALAKAGQALGYGSPTLIYFEVQHYEENLSRKARSIHHNGGLFRGFGSGVALDLE
jgi:hypothetical protein